MRALTHLIRQHDEIPAFHASYLVLTFLAAAMFNVGVFAVLVAVHIALDCVKYHSVQSRSVSDTALLSLRESIIDIALLLIALVFAVYLHSGAGIVALSGILRAEGTLIRAAGMIIPKLGIIGHEVPVFSHIPYHLHEQGARSSFTKREQFFFALGVIAFMLLLVSPLSIGVETVSGILEQELIPWRW